MRTGGYTSMLSTPSFCNIRLRVMRICMGTMSGRAFKKSATHCKSRWGRETQTLLCIYSEADSRRCVPFIALSFHQMLNVIDFFVNTMRR